MGHIVHKVSSETASQFTAILRSLIKKGWKADLDDRGGIRLHKEGNPNCYCPLTAACLEFHDTDLNYRRDTKKAGEILGLETEETWGLVAAADRGATIDDHGPRFCPGWGYSKPLRYRIEMALKLVSPHQIWKILRARAA